MHAAAAGLGTSAAASDGPVAGPPTAAAAAAAAEQDAEQDELVRAAKRSKPATGGAEADVEPEGSQTLDGGAKGLFE
eukprot:SAG22_NODE_2432_length_2578_cov_27.780153_2_plen_77_part_00